MNDEIEYQDFTPEKHLSGVLALCEVEGWMSHRLMSNEVRRKCFTAPGVSTVVAVNRGRVVGFAKMQSDGVLQAHLSVIAVDGGLRRSGVGERLVREALERSGGERVDLLAEDGALGFYRSFRHVEQVGFRLYPATKDGSREATT